MEIRSNNYKENLIAGLEFQDYIAVEFSKLGMAITSFSSKKYQFSKGENLQGFEIKFDRMFRQTGNFWIEVKEKSKATNCNYIESGISRSDNTRFYVIGDYEGVYIMQKKVLVAMSKKYGLIENGSKTSIGFLLKVIDAEKLFDYIKLNK